MQINFHQKNLQLSDNQKDYVSGKIEGLAIFSIMADPSVLAKVNVEYHEHVDSDKKIMMKVTIDIPGEVLHAESPCSSPEEGIDLVEAKLRHQLEKYKTTHE